MDFKERFLQIDKEKRQAHSFNILSNDNKLRNDFLEIFSDEFIAEPTMNNGSDPVDMALNDIREIANERSSELNDVDFEDIEWNCNSEPGYYQQYYEIAKEYYEQEFWDVLESRLDELNSNIKAGSLTEVIAWISGIYQGRVRI